MEDEDYILVNARQDYSKVVQTDGVRTTVCANRFEILTSARAEVQEQQAMQQLREWIRWRKEKELRTVGSLPE
jgi:hypothetical protein